MNTLNVISNAAMLSCLGTSIHETDIRSFNSNALRVYNPVTGIRHRKASTTSEIRQKICSYILNTFPNVRRIKIVDTGKTFQLAYGSSLVGHFVRKHIQSGICMEY